MGAGKSYLGRNLATLLGFQFIDLDEYIESQSGKSISSIFKELGENAFRQIESDCLQSLALPNHSVVATGGGCPCFLGNLAWMNEHGVSVYFFAPASLLAKRLFPEKENRPLLAPLTKDNFEAFIDAKLAERATFYEQCHLKFKVPEFGQNGLEELADYLRKFFT